MTIPFRLRNSRGLTLIEVLVASTIFMIGFSIIVFLLNRITGNYSSKEQVIASQLAVQQMETTLASGEYAPEQKIETRSNLAFKIERLTEWKDRLVTIRINVFRVKSGKLLATLYNEKYVR